MVEVFGDKHMDIVAGFGAIVPLVSLVAASVPKRGFGSRSSVVFALALTPTALMGRYDWFLISGFAIMSLARPFLVYPMPMQPPYMRI